MILLILTYGKKLNSIKFISEIASTHNGSEKYLKKLSKRILNGDSDFIKFQIFKNKNLCHKSSKFYNGLKKIEINQKTWRKIIAYSLKKKRVILEPFDDQSYKFCKYFKRNVFLKISSSEHDNLPMIEDGLKNFKKVFFNISGFNFKQILNLINCFKKYKKKIVLMYGFQSFPSDPKDLRLSLISDIKKKLKIDVGYADHSLTDKIPPTYLLTAKAIDYGAIYIEKHVTFKRNEKKPDYISSFEPQNFDEYVNYFKKDYFIKFRDEISPKEEKYCNVMGKFAFTNKNIFKGEVINFEKLKFLRASQKGITRDEIRKILKKKIYSSQNIKKDELFKKKFFK